MIWAFLSRFNDILAFIGFLMVIKWSIQATIWASAKFRRVNSQTKEI